MSQVKSLSVNQPYQIKIGGQWFTIKSLKDINRAKDQARLQVESIIEMVDRLEHCQDCNGKNCDLTDEEICKGINIHWTSKTKITEEEREEYLDEYHDEEEARQIINEDPLTVQIRSDWHSPGEKTEAAEFEILLCTGGPATRLIGELDEYRQPESVKLQHQDWFTPWTDYPLTSEEENKLLDYCQQFYFGE